MKIIQHGRPKEALRSTKRFKCSFCGCVFEVDKGEYKAGSQYNEVYFSCECPECRKSANEIVVWGDTR